jgi:hypothetical protein
MHGKRRFNLAEIRPTRRDRGWHLEDGLVMAQRPVRRGDQFKRASPNDERLPLCSQPPQACDPESYAASLTVDISQASTPNKIAVSAPIGPTTLQSAAQPRTVWTTGVSRIGTPVRIRNTRNAGATV